MSNNRQRQQGTRLAMVIELDRCIDCKACVVACKAENEVPTGKSRNQVDRVGPQGTFPNLGMHFIPQACHHCDNPPCMRVCPTGATYQREDGSVLLNRDTCIGCRYCLMACPYDARYYDEESGMVDKCTFCVHRVDRGQEPACVTTCPTKVRHFGNTLNREGELYRLLSRHKVRRLKEEAGTDPQLHYICLKLNL